MGVSAGEVGGAGVAGAGEKAAVVVAGGENPACLGRRPDHDGPACVVSGCWAGGGHDRRVTVSAGVDGDGVAEVVLDDGVGGDRVGRALRFGLAGGAAAGKAGRDGRPFAGVGDRA